MSQQILEMYDVAEVTVVRFCRPMRFLVAWPDFREELRDRFTWLTQEMGRRFIILNFDQVWKASPTVVEPVHQAFHLVQKVNGKLVICGLEPEIRKDFSVRIILPGPKIVQSEEEGLKYLSS